MLRLCSDSCFSRVCPEKLRIHWPSSNGKRVYPSSTGIPLLHTTGESYYWKNERCSKYIEYSLYIFRVAQWLVECRPIGHLMWVYGIRIRERDCDLKSITILLGSIRCIKRAFYLPCTYTNDPDGIAACTSSRESVPHSYGIWWNRWKR